MALFQNLLSSISFGHCLNFLIFLVFLYIGDFYYKYFNHVNKLPGPFPLPIIGSLWNKRDRYNEWILKLQRKYGDIFEVWLGPTRKIYLCRAEYFDKILSLNTKSKWLSRMRATEGTFELGMGQRGVWLNANVEDWKYNRHFFNQVMLASGFNLKAVDATNKMLKDMKQYWIMLGKDHPIDLCKWMDRFTIEMVSVITTGKRSYSLLAYFNTLSTKKADILSSILEDSEYLIKNFEKFFSSLPIFTIFPYYIRHYFPILRI
ncbi:cytochrome P450 [Gigaspora rosea]|uniref:Cytochrome P450 n=1 Tax=Gigaspora rosea TaxID=44941 RepID=A0A397VSQ2_9GLOM|nr:cytochrome P450 [Gigaspora rosea]